MTSRLSYTHTLPVAECLCFVSQALAAPPNIFTANASRALTHIDIFTPDLVARSCTSTAHTGFAE